MKTIIIWVLGIVSSLTGLIGFALIGAIPIMLLWNWLMPALFGLTKVGLLKALGLSILAGLLIRK